MHSHAEPMTLWSPLAEARGRGTHALWVDARGRFLETSVSLWLTPPPVLSVSVDAGITSADVLFNPLTFHTFGFGRREADVWLHSTFSFQNMLS